MMFCFALFSYGSHYGYLVYALSILFRFCYRGLLCSKFPVNVFILVQWLKTSLSVREFGGSSPGLVKWETVSPTSHHRSDVSSELCSSCDKPRR